MPPPKLSARNHTNRESTGRLRVSWNNVKVTHPLTHKFTVAGPLHRATVAGPDNVVTELGHLHTVGGGAVRSRARDGGRDVRGACSRRGSSRSGTHGHARRQRRAHDTGARVNQRRHTTASVAMTKRPGTRARSATQPPESPRPSAISHDVGVNKPATLLLLTQWWG